MLGALRKVAEATDVSVARVALAWQLTRPFVTSVIIGAKNREQLADNLAAADVKLSPEHVDAARRGERAAARVSGLDGRVPEPRDPRGVSGAPTEAQIRAVAGRLK